MQPVVVSDMLKELGLPGKVEIQQSDEYSVSGLIPDLNMNELLKNLRFDAYYYNGMTFNGREVVLRIRYRFGERWVNTVTQLYDMPLGLQFHCMVENVPYFSEMGGPMRFMPTLQMADSLKFAEDEALVGGS